MKKAFIFVTKLNIIILFITTIVHKEHKKLMFKNGNGELTAKMSKKAINDWLTYRPTSGRLYVAQAAMLELYAALQRMR